MDDQEKLVKLLEEFVEVDCWDNGEFIEKDIDFCKIAENLISKGVTLQRSCCNAESVISNTRLMCTACYSDIDTDAFFCKYCGAKVLNI